MISLCFLIIVIAMSYELTRDVGGAARLTQELLASEARLHESEQRMELAASAAELGLWTWDVAGDEIWSTEKGRALFGFSHAEPIDFNRFVGRLHPDDREPVRQAVTRSLEGGGDYESEYRVLPPNAPMRWIAARGRVEIDAGGRPLRMRGISLDITRHKHAELEVQHQRKELAHLARVTLLGELSGSLAHELNQPLTAILSNAQAAQRFLPKGSTGPDDEVREILTDIVEETKRAGEVIQRLRLLLKKGEVQQRPLDVNEVAQDVLKIAHSDLVNHNIRLRTALAPGLPAVHGDRVQLQQVLLNLIVNGCDAMTEAAARDREIVVRTARCDEGVRVSVCDRGRGIPSEQLERIFESFVTTKAEGMGLGLAVCRTIVEAHGGRLWPENNADRGASFHFTLPVNLGGCG